VLEEAAYVDPGFFYETVAPLLLIGNTSLIAISTLTSEINFYTRLLRMRDKVTGLPLFTSISVQLACKKCIEDGQPASCVHMLHLVPRWQSSDRHVKLKTVMQDRPDLIESELSGLAFDSNHQIFKSSDLDVMFAQAPPRPVLNEAVFLFIDPAAGGPQSDYAVLSVTRHKGLLTVVGIDILTACKDPERQFDLVGKHIARIRQDQGRKASRVFVYVERNLGFEAEHHKRALEHIPGVSFYVDQAASRVGVLTTEATKHAMATLVVAMLAERRIHVQDPLYSNDPAGLRVRLREQMETYSAQYKSAPDTFGKDRIALSGKVGGMKDDVCICLQLAAYYTQLETQRAAAVFSKIQ